MRNYALDPPHPEQPQQEQPESHEPSPAPAVSANAVWAKEKSVSVRCPLTTLFVAISPIKRESRDTAETFIYLCIFFIKMYNYFNLLMSIVLYSIAHNIERVT